jgi:hypothetical protein
MRIYLSTRSVIVHAQLPGGWPDAAVIAALAEAMSETTRECVACPDVPAAAFLEAIAKAAPLEVAADLYELARWRRSGRQRFQRPACRSALRRAFRR